MHQSNVNRRFRWPVIFALVVLIMSGPAQSEAPFIDPAEDHKHFGSPDNTLFWTPHEQVAGYRNAEKLLWGRKINSGDAALDLPERHQDLGAISVASNDQNMSLDEYMTHGNVAGLLVLKDGAVLFERYGLGNTRDSRWTSFSVAKSVVSLLVGAAIQDGYIKSVDEKITDYLPRLKSSAYDQVTIQNALQMSSGVEWNENYEDPESDVASARWDTLLLSEHLARKPLQADRDLKVPFKPKILMRRGRPVSRRWRSTRADRPSPSKPNLRR